MQRIIKQDDRVHGFYPKYNHRKDRTPSPDSIPVKETFQILFIYECLKVNKTRSWMASHSLPFQNSDKSQAKKASSTQSSLKL